MSSLTSKVILTRRKTELEKKVGNVSLGKECLLSKKWDREVLKWWKARLGTLQKTKLGLSISRSIFISREREFPKHFGYFPGISRELKTYLIANRKYPIFERKCIFWGSRIILSFVTIIFDSKVWFWAQRKISKIEWNRKICQSQYIKISRNFPGNRKNSRDQAGLKIFGKFPGFPGREFPGTSPIQFGSQPNVRPLLKLKMMKIAYIFKKYVKKILHLHTGQMLSNCLATN